MLFFTAASKEGDTENHTETENRKKDREKDPIVDVYRSKASKRIDLQIDIFDTEPEPEDESFPLALTHSSSVRNRERDARKR